MGSKRIQQVLLIAGTKSELKRVGKKRVTQALRDDLAKKVIKRFKV